MKTFVQALVLLGLALPASATEYVKLKDGTPLRGEATSYDEASRMLTFKMEDGLQRRIGLDELDKRSLYLVNHSRVPKNDAKKQIRIGNLARDAKLYQHAMRHYGYAAKADAAMKAEVEREIATLRHEAAGFGLQQARAELAKGNTREAERWFVRIVEKVPGEPEAAEARAWLEQTYAKSREDQEAKAHKAAGAALDKDLAKLKKHYDSMLEKTQKGLTDDRAGSQAVAHFEDAVRDGEKVIEGLDEVRGEQSDPAVRERLDGYRDVAVGHVIEAHMHLASLWTTRSSYNKAMAEANKALALDSKNAQALAARARIEAASAERGWLW